jgi:glucarate dehydratase
MVKITGVKATPINMPLEVPYTWSFGAFPGFTKTIVEVETDQGVVGLGEAPFNGAAAILDGGMTERLVGRDPIDITGCELACLPHWRGMQSINEFADIATFGAVEMALWDIRGKVWDRPVYDLLGGACRNDIPFTEYFAFRPAVDGKGGETTIEALVDYCLDKAAIHGSSFFEGKVSEPDPRASIAIVRALRDALGDDAMIRIDSNHAYSVTTAKVIAAAFEELGVRNWEDPVPTFEEMVRLRPHTSVPFSSHNTDIPKAVALGVPDAIVGNIAGHGGFLRAGRFVAALEAMAIDYWCYSGDSGIGTAAYLHFCAATQWVREPNQSLLRWQPVDVIEGGTMLPVDNIIRVPDGPGLGVTLDRAGLDWCHRHLVDNGPLPHFSDPDRPGQFRRLPLS